MTTLKELIFKISELPADWHKSGSVSYKVLNKILHHSNTLSEIKNTAETGSGKTTLLFSHLSKSHTVFSLDNWESISVVKKSPLFNPENVRFIEGPTQKTLPYYNFMEKLDIVLLDGPHGYPFPDLEYYFFYPHISVGGLLLLDDIQIPSLNRMYKILKKEKMFILLETVNNMAFFKRTNHELINPVSDSWWLQGYNEKHYYRRIQLSKIKSLIPPKLKKIVKSIF